MGLAPPESGPPQAIRLCPGSLVVPCRPRRLLEVSSEWQSILITAISERVCSCVMIAGCECSEWLHGVSRHGLLQRVGKNRRATIHCCSSARLNALFVWAHVCVQSLFYKTNLLEAYCS